MVRWLKLASPFLYAVGLYLLVEIILGTPTVSNLLEARVENHLAHKLKELNQSPDFEVLAFGTSRTLHGFDTQQFELEAPVKLAAYNLGVVSGDYYIFQLILANYLKHHQKPRLIVLEASDFILNNNRMSDSNLMYLRTLISLDPANTKTILSSHQLSTENKLELLFSNLSTTYRYRSLIAPTTLMHLFLDGPKGKVSLTKGWTPFADPVDQNWVAKSDEFAANRIRKIFAHTHTLASERLESFLAYCRTQGIPVVMLQWPYHRAYQSAFNRQPYAVTYPQILRSITTHHHLGLLSFPASNQTSLFGDVDHLNAQGACITTTQIARQVFSHRQIAKLFQDLPPRSKTSHTPCQPLQK